MWKASLKTRGGMWLLLMAGALTGCSGGGPDLAPAAGTVTLDGKPLEGARLVFYLQGKSVPGYMGSSIATTDAAGKYELTTNGQPGVAPGDYKVTIGQLLRKDGAPVEPEEGMDITMLEMEGLAKQSLPAKYSDFETSELSVKVEKGQGKNYDFQLESP